LGEARIHPVLAGKRSGGVEEEPEGGEYQGGEGVNPGGTKRVGEVHSFGPPENPEKNTRGIPGTEGRQRHINIEMAVGDPGGGGEEKKLARIDYGDLHGIMPRSISQPSHLFQGCSPGSASPLSGMDSRFKRSGECGKGRAGKPGSDCNSGDHGESNQGGACASSESRTGGSLGDSGKGRRHCETEGNGYRVSPRREEPKDKGSIRHWKDCIEPALHNSLSAPVKGGPGICVREEGSHVPRRGKDSMAVPRDRWLNAKDSIEESGREIGTTFHQERSNPVSSGVGSIGFGVNELLSTQVDRNPKKISGVGMALRRREGERQEGRGNGVVQEGLNGTRVPRYYKKFFIDPPSWEEVQAAFPEMGDIQRNRYPLNVKRVKPGDINKLKNLSFLHEECKLFLLNSLRVLEDEKMYKEMCGSTKSPPFQKPALSAKELELLIDYKLERADAKPLWPTFPFKVVEVHKKRCRGIFDCKINSVFTETPKYKLKNKSRIRKDLNQSYEEFIFIQFDFKSFYDQFILSLCVRKYFGVLGHDDLYYFLKLLPMGFRLAVACAQATMWALLDFSRSMKVAIATCIDNVCFSGPRAEVYAAVDAFLMRVFLCNFTLNGLEEIDYTNLDKEEKEELFKKWEENTPEFLGEKYNLTKKERSMTDKTLTKLTNVWGAMEYFLFSNKEKSLTPRKFFCLVGLIIYASGVLNIDTYEYFNLFKKIRNLSSQMNKDESLWDKPLSLGLTNLELTNLRNWVES